MIREPPTPKMRSEKELALTPALSPGRGGSLLSFQEFSRSRLWRHLIGTYVGRYSCTGLQGGFLVAVFALGLAVFQAVGVLARGTESTPAAAATNALRPLQIISTNRPPLPPTEFNPDAGLLP